MVSGSRLPGLLPKVSQTLGRRKRISGAAVLLLLAAATVLTLFMGPGFPKLEQLTEKVSYSARLTMVRPLAQPVQNYSGQVHRNECNEVSQHTPFDIIALLKIFSS